ncbi:MAG: hypothetical protein HFJ52_02035 [Clostridia bacterium]|nr:hypothetical protein [Clostridia bacterium]
MKKKIFVITWLIIIIWIISLIIFIMINHNNKSNVKIVDTKKGIVIDANKNSLTIYTYDRNSGTTEVIPYAKEGNIGFKRGQEVEAYYTMEKIGRIPTQTVSKIKIKKQKSKIKIPDSELRKLYYKKQNVSVTVENLTPTGIKYNIIDKNDLPYKYGNGLTYKIFKRTKISENEERYKELTHVDMSWIETIKSSTNIDKHTFERIYDWTKYYGALEEGEYKLDIFTKYLIKIEFKVEESGKTELIKIHI